MALKEIWKDKQDGVDFILAEDINNIANAVVDLEENGGGTLTLDEEMSDTSTNAVQNKVIKAYVDNAIASIPTLPEAEGVEF